MLLASFLALRTGLRSFWLLFDLLADAVFLLAEFGGEFGAEVFGFEDGADFDFGSAVEGSAFQPFQGFVHRSHLPEPEAGDQLFGVGEGAVGDGGLASGKFYAFAF